MTIANQPNDPENRTRLIDQTPNASASATSTVKGLHTYPSVHTARPLNKGWLSNQRTKTVLAISFVSSVICAIILIGILVYFLRRGRRKRLPVKLKARVPKKCRKRWRAKTGYTMATRDFLAPSVGFSSLSQDDDTNISGNLIDKKVEKRSDLPKFQVDVKHSSAAFPKSTTVGRQLPSIPEDEPDHQVLDNSIIKSPVIPKFEGRVGPNNRFSSPNSISRLRDSALLFPSDSSLSINGSLQHSASSTIESHTNHTDSTNGSVDFAAVTANIRMHTRERRRSRVSEESTVQSDAISRHRVDSPTLAAEIYESEFLLQQRLQRMRDSQSLRNYSLANGSTTNTDDTASERSVY